MGHLGDTVLFLQWVIATYQAGHHPYLRRYASDRSLPPQLHRCSFTWEQKVVDPGIVKNVAARPHEVPQEELPSFRAWFKALFDQNSDGIEDTILRYLVVKH